ncbi:MAG: ABC transporter permease [Actinomycetota bacterium]|jgi:putative spermidine/putrescine transport system permease protein
MESRFVRIAVRVGAGLTLAFLYVPLVIVVVYAFNKSVSGSWPPQLFTLKWFSVAWQDATLKGALRTSVIAAICATGIALVLGSLASFAVHKFAFFGRDAVSFILVLPIALPGIVTALALSSAVESSRTSIGLTFGLAAIVLGHATFCVVVVYNNVVARLRRTPGSLTEASMDLGGDGPTTFRRVTLPNLRTAIIAGALLAFGLSFDEIVVTKYLAGTVLTLPLWIYGNIQRPFNRPIVNVVALVVLVVSIIPIYIAQHLTGTAQGVASVEAEEAGPG